MLRLGVVGYGGRAHGVVKDSLRAVEPEVTVVGVVDPAAERARERLAEIGCAQAQFYETLDDLVAGAALDGLLIGTRCNLHADLAVAAARHPLPLYLEKPVAIEMDQARRLEEAYARGGPPVVVSFPLRVSPLCRQARAFIEQGEIGEPVHIAATNYVPYGVVYWEEAYRDYGITGGLFLQKATHDLDYMTYLMGAAPVRVAAMMTRHRVFGGARPAGLRCSACGETVTCPESPENRRRSDTSPKHDHPCLFSVDCGTPESGTNEDCSSCLVEFPGGGHGVYTQVFFVRRPENGQRGANVSGYKGSVRFDWYSGDLTLVRNHVPVVQSARTAEGMAHFGGDQQLAMDFVDLMRGRIRASRAPLCTGLQSVYTCLAARESAATGRYVEVRQVGR